MYKAVLIVCVLLVGCALPTRVFSPDEKAYLNKIKGYPERFRIHKSQASDIWERARAFVGRYGSTIIATSNENVIATYGTDKFGFSYCVVKAPVGDSVEFDFQCTAMDRFYNNNAMINRWAWEDYSLTGSQVMSSVVSVIATNMVHW